MLQKMFPRNVFITAVPCGKDGHGPPFGAKMMVSVPSCSQSCSPTVNLKSADITKMGTFFEGAPQARPGAVRRARPARPLENFGDLQACNGRFPLKMRAKSSTNGHCARPRPAFEVGFFAMLAGGRPQCAQSQRRRFNPQSATANRAAARGRDHRGPRIGTDPSFEPKPCPQLQTRRRADFLWGTEIVLLITFL